MAITSPTSAPARGRLPAVLLRRAAGLPLRLVPVHRRFGAAVWLAQALARLVRRTDAFRKHMAKNTDGAADVALYRILHLCAATGTAYDPVLRVEGRDVLDAARAAGGVLVVTTHAVLAPLFLRWLDDQGCVAHTVYAAPGASLPGTRQEVAALHTSSTLLLRVRTLLRRGEVVCARIGRSTPEHSTLRIDTVSGPVYASDEMLHVATRTRARVVFVWVRVERGEVRVTLAAPASGSESDPAALAGDFGRFVQAQVALVARHEGRT